MKIEQKEIWLEIKSEEGKPLTLEGYVGAFGNIDSHGDLLMKGAVSEQVGHTIDAMLGHYEDVGAMTILEEDDYGIKVFVEFMPEDVMPEHAKHIGKQLRWKFDKGIKYKMSIGFIPKEVERNNIPDELKLKGCERILKKIQLVEGSVVVLPSNDKAIITDYKSAKLDTKEIENCDVRQLEAKLSEGLPMSNNVAKRIAGLLKSNKEDSNETALKAFADIASAIKSAAM